MTGYPMMHLVNAVVFLSARSVIKYGCTVQSISNGIWIILMTNDEPKETTKLEDLDKEDLVDRCRELEFWNLRMTDHNQNLRLRIGQYEAIFDCPNCKKNVLIELVRERGGHGGSFIYVCTRCAECNGKLENMELKFV
jgi:hypothetical protein